MNTPVLVVCALCVIAAIVILYLDHRRTAEQILAMRKMRGSPLYTQIYHRVVENVRDKDIEEIRVERDRVVVIGVYPRVKLAEYDLESNGHRFLNNEKVLALANVLALDIEQLQNVKDYEFTRITLERPNGGMDYSYLYIIRSAAKKRITEAHRRISYNRLY